jgi:hypothetical protein
VPLCQSPLGASGASLPSQFHNKIECQRALETAFTSLEAGGRWLPHRERPWAQTQADVDNRFAPSGARRQGWPRRTAARVGLRQNERIRRENSGAYSTLLVSRPCRTKQRGATLYIKPLHWNAGVLPSRALKDRRSIPLTKPERGPRGPFLRGG